MGPTRDYALDRKCILVGVLSPFQNKVAYKQILNINIKKSLRIKGVNEIKLNHVSI